ncbi:MAG: glycerol-3-phosphate 1-O-acyltransferase PlsY [Gammaproteobacteria bacterium]|jgi:glycerol-3-phosphate acyltransferase PlsY
MLIDIICIIIAYLLGSISSAIIICKLFGYPDPRTLGSGNAGATNVLRIAGKKLAIFTLILDALKGFVAVMIARTLGLDNFILGVVALAAFLGHLYPIFFKFKGGKGIATGLGVMLGLSPELGGMVIVTWILIAAIFRYSSLAAIVAFVLAPIYAFFLTNRQYVIALFIMMLFILWRHRTNIKRLLQKVEPKI